MKQNNSRMSARSLAVVIGAGALLGACATPYSEAPTATNFETTNQRKLQAGQHWNVIANDAAESIITALNVGKGCIAAAPNCEKIFVQPAKDKTAFNRAFHNAFITALVQRGVNVVKTADGATGIEFDTQVIRFSPRRPDGNFTSFAALYSGLWSLRGIWVSASPGAAGLAAMGGRDVYTWNMSEFASGPTPQHEIILTVSAANGDKYLGRATNIYYVADSDEALYTYAPPPPKPALPGINIQVKGGD